MKQTHPLSTAVTAALILAGAAIIVGFPVMLIMRAPEAETVQAAAGLVDMREILETGADKVYALEGEWEFYAGRLYTDEDFQAAARGIGNIDPPKLVTVPHVWTKDGFSQKGYGTYRLRIKTPPDGGSLSVYSLRQYTASELYLNGEEAASGGRIDPSFEKFVMGMVYLIGHTTAVDGEVSVIFHIQNEIHRSPGLRSKVFFSASKTIDTFKTAAVTIDLLISGWLGLLFFYFLMVYIHNKDRSEYRDYAWGVLAGMYLGLQNNGGALSPFRFVVDNPFFTGVIAERIAYASAGLGVFFFIRHYLKRIVPERVMRPLHWGCIIILGSPLWLPGHLFTNLYTVNAAAALALCTVPLLSAFPLAADYFRGKGREEFNSLKRADLLLEVGSRGILLFAPLSYLIHIPGILGMVNMFVVVMTFHVLLQMVVFLRHYRGLERKVRELNQGLEEKVAARTKALEKMTREAEKAKKEAEEASRYKSDFLARMSHEMRTPLNAIIGMSELMPTENFTPLQHRYFRDMTGMSNMLFRLINHILDFSKIEAGKMEVSLSHYNVRGLYDNVASMGRFLARDKGLKFTASFAPDIPEVLYGDELRVRQVLINLVNNAIKYTPNGLVELRLRTEARVTGSGGKTLPETRLFLAAEVKDTGRGIKKEDQRKLFGVFEQFDREKNKGISGTGLGLAITRQLVSMMGGFIRVDSEYGRGSTFTAFIPLVKGDPSKVEETAWAGEIVTASADVNVLVVDDMRVNLNVASGLLARYNIHADTAESGEEALSKAKALAEAGKSYDIIFMDHMMPGMDGIETTRLYRDWEIAARPGGRWGETPIIAFSANVVHGARELFLSSGMNDCLSKPVKAADITRILKKWLPKDKLVIGYQEEGQAPNSDNGPGNGLGLGLDFGGDAQAASSPPSPPSQIMPLLAVLGVDAQAALEHLGDEKGIIDFLTTLSQDYPGYLERLGRFHGEADWKNYAVIVHGLKGAFAALGNEALAAEARAMEGAAKAAREPDCLVWHEPLMEKFRAFYARMTEALERYHARPGAGGGAGEGGGTGNRELGTGEETAMGGSGSVPASPNSPPSAEGDGPSDLASLRKALKRFYAAVLDSRSREALALTETLSAITLDPSVPPETAAAFQAAWREIRPMVEAFDFPAATVRAGELLKEMPEE